MILDIAEKPSLWRAITDASGKHHREVNECTYTVNSSVLSGCIGHLLTQINAKMHVPLFNSLLCFYHSIILSMMNYYFHLKGSFK